MSPASRIDALTMLASRVGYALRKAFPVLRPGDRELFLGPLADVLDDIGMVLRPTGLLVADIDIMPSSKRPILNLFKAVAAPPSTLGWKAPNIHDCLVHITHSLSNIDMLDNVPDDTPTIATTHDQNFAIELDAIVLDGPITEAATAFDAVWGFHLDRVAAAFARLAAALSAPPAVLPPPAPSSCCGLPRGDDGCGHGGALSSTSSAACTRVRLLATRVQAFTLGTGCVFLIQLNPAAFDVEFIIIECDSDSDIDSLCIAIEDHLSHALSLPIWHAVQVFLEHDDMIIEDLVSTAPLHGHQLQGSLMYCVDEFDAG